MIGIFSDEWRNRTFVYRRQSGGRLPSQSKRAEIPQKRRELAKETSAQCPAWFGAQKFREGSSGRPSTTMSSHPGSLSVWASDQNGIDSGLGGSCYCSACMQMSRVILRPRTPLRRCDRPRSSLLPHLHTLPPTAPEKGTHQKSRPPTNRQQHY